MKFVHQLLSVIIFYNTNIIKGEEYIDDTSGYDVLYYSDGTYNLPVCATGWDTSLNDNLCSSWGYGSQDTSTSDSVSDGSLGTGGYFTASVALWAVTFTRVTSGSCSQFVTIGCTYDVCGKNGFGAASFSSRIINGVDADFGKWPWQISLFYNGGQICGGTLVTDSWVITAAHCVADDADVTAYSVDIGNTRLSNGTIYAYYYGWDTEVGAQNSDVAEIVVHFEYDTTTLDNDIALIRLATPVTFTKYVRAACLAPATEDVPLDSVCYATGWGDTEQAGTNWPNYLQEVRQSLIENDTCATDDIIAGLGGITDNMICSGTNTTGTCQGDSGGPLVCLGFNDQWVLLGVTSWGDEDCTSISVYAKVQSYPAWMFYLSSEDIGIVTEMRFSSSSGCSVLICSQCYVMILLLSVLLCIV